jgi:hypothetical protein
MFTFWSSPAVKRNAANHSYTLKIKIGFSLLSIIVKLLIPSIHAISTSSLPRGLVTFIYIISPFAWIFWVRMKPNNNHRYMYRISLSARFCFLHVRRRRFVQRERYCKTEVNVLNLKQEADRKISSVAWEDNKRLTNVRTRGWSEANQWLTSILTCGLTRGCCLQEHIKNKL